MILKKIRFLEMRSVLKSKLDRILAVTKIELKTCDTRFDENGTLDFKKVLQRDITPNLYLS